MKLKLFVGLTSMLMVFLISRPAMHNQYYIAGSSSHSEVGQLQAAAGDTVNPYTVTVPYEIIANDDYMSEYNEDEHYENDYYAMRLSDRKLNMQIRRNANRSEDNDTEAQYPYHELE